MTDDGFDDPIERELQRRFADAGPGPDDTDAVLTSMQPRLRRARRGRRALSASVAVLGVALLIVVGFAALSGTESTRRVNVPPATRSPGVPTTVVTPDGADAPDGPDANGANDAVDGGGTTPPAPTTTPAGEAPTATTDPGGAENATPPATAPTGDTPYSSLGGSIVVHRAGDTISLASSTPAVGFTQEVHDNGPTRVEVRFKGDETEWRTRVDLVNGELVAETTQHG